jgi:hypothetical protein
MHDVGKTGYTAWDIATGKLQQPKDKTEEKDTDKDEDEDEDEDDSEEKDDKVTLDTTKLSKNEWTKANYFALLTMKKNCDEEPPTKFELA